MQSRQGHGDGEKIGEVPSSVMKVMGAKTGRVPVQSRQGHCEVSSSIVDRWRVNKGEVSMGDDDDCDIFGMLQSPCDPN